MLVLGRLLVALAAAVAADDCQVDQGSCSTHLLQAQAERRAAARHHWPTFRGRSQTAATNEAPPKDLSTPAWTWTHPKGQYHSLMSGGPVIDKDWNLYLKTAQGIRKFSPEGEELWMFQVPGGSSNNEPSLYGNMVLGSTIKGHAFALDRNTGKALWTSQLSDSGGGDCGYPAAHNGVFVVGVEAGHDPRSDGGNRKIFGLDVQTGKTLWKYSPDNVVWNFSPLFPDDQTVVFMDFTGGMYKLGLENGQELWKTPAPQSSESFSDGGASLGQDGKVYTCSNYADSRGADGTQGVARAFDIQSGNIAWEKILSKPCNSFPAVGKVRGSDRLAVALLPGPFIGQPNLSANILALDAATGEELWTFNTDAWTGPGNNAAGDVEGIQDRLSEGIQPMCVPAHWSAATIDGSGTVYAARLNGQLYAVHGPKETLDMKELNPALVVDPKTGVAAEIRTLGSCSLHGAQAWAPGMYALSTCDTLYVYKTG